MQGVLLDAGIIAINGTFVVEVISFLVMLVILARFVYPPIEAAASRRQAAIADALEAAEKQRAEAEESLKEAQAQLEDARRQAQEVLSGATRSADQVRSEAKQKADEEAAARLERARQDIDSARRAAVEAVRAEVADMVVTATERVVGEVVDVKAHRGLIDKALEDVRRAQEEDVQRNGSGRGR